MISIKKIILLPFLGIFFIFRFSSNIFLKIKVLYLNIKAKTKYFHLYDSISLISLNTYFFNYKHLEKLLDETSTRIKLLLDKPDLIWQEIQYINEVLHQVVWVGSIANQHSLNLDGRFLSPAHYIDLLQVIIQRSTIISSNIENNYKTQHVTIYTYSKILRWMQKSNCIQYSDDLLTSILNTYPSANYQILSLSLPACYSALSVAQKEINKVLEEITLSQEKVELNLKWIMSIILMTRSYQHATLIIDSVRALKEKISTKDFIESLVQMLEVPQLHNSILTELSELRNTSSGYHHAQIQIAIISSYIRRGQTKFLKKEFDAIKTIHLIKPELLLPFLKYSENHNPTFRFYFLQLALKTFSRFLYFNTPHRSKFLLYNLTDISNDKRKQILSKASILYHVLIFKIKLKQLLKKQPANKNFFIFTAQDEINSIAWPFPIIAALAKNNNFTLVNLHQDNFKLPSSKHFPKLIERSSAIEGHDIHWNSLMNQVHSIEPNKKLVTINNQNHYQPLFEQVGRIYKVFRIDWSSYAVQSTFWNLLLRLDRNIYAFDLIENIAKKNDFKIRYATVQNHYTPWSVFKVLSGLAQNTCSQYIHIGAGYENWKHQLTNKTFSTIVALNLSVFTTRRAAFLGSPQHFQDWVQQKRHTNVDFSNYDEKYSLNKPTATKKIPEELANKIYEVKKAGGKIFCALGKTVYDLAVPEMKGFIHDDLCDWIRHTSKQFTKPNKNLLIIKPHPHEIKPELTNIPNEFFLDLVADINSDNIIKLQHKDISLESLRGNVDTFLIWNGTSILELGAWGENVLTFDTWSEKDYDVFTKHPTSIEQYEQILKGESSIKMDPRYMKFSLFYLKYMVSKELMVSVRSVSRSSTNVKYDEPRYSIMNSTKAIIFPTKQLRELAKQFNLNNEFEK